jgi:hypothetical protein
LTATLHILIVSYTFINYFGTKYKLLLIISADRWLPLLLTLFLVYLIISAARSYFLICLFSFPYAASSLHIIKYKSIFSFPNCRLFSSQIAGSWLFSLLLSLYSLVFVFSSFSFPNTKLFFVFITNLSSLFSSSLPKGSVCFGLENVFRKTFSAFAGVCCNVKQKSN